jgi:hypothetical protein
MAVAGLRASVLWADGDDEALAFGKQVIRDLMLGDQRFAGWMMDITSGERPVGSIPLETIQTTSRKR